MAEKRLKQRLRKQRSEIHRRGKSENRNSKNPYKWRIKKSKPRWACILYLRWVLDRPHYHRSGHFTPIQQPRLSTPHRRRNDLKIPLKNGGPKGLKRPKSSKNKAPTEINSKSSPGEYLKITNQKLYMGTEKSKGPAHRMLDSRWVKHRPRGRTPGNAFFVKVEKSP
jgi:hypothetical protein